MKPSTYLETSVIGAYLDNGEPFRRDLTIRWWEHELSEYRAVISPLVVRELERVSEPHRTGVSETGERSRTEWNSRKKPRFLPKDMSRAGSFIESLLLTLCM